MIWSVAVACLVIDPLVPVTVSVRVAFLVLDDTVAVKVEVPLPLGIEFGLRLRVTPVVPPLTVRFTGLVKVPTAATFTV